MRRVRAFFLYSLLLAMAGSLQAFTSLWPKGTVPRLALKTTAQPAADIDPRFGGELEINQALLSAGLGRFSDDGLFYNVVLTYGYHDFTFSDTGGGWLLDGGSVETLELDAAFSTLTHGDLGPYLQFRVSGGGGEGFGVLDARSYFGVGGIRWAYSDDLNLVFGALWWDSASEGSRVLPFAGLRWEIGNNFILSTRNGAVLEWMLDDWGEHWLNLSLLYQSRSFALAPPSTTLPAVAEGVVEATAWELMAEYRWQVSRAFALRLSAGYRFDRRYTFFLDETERDRLTVDAGPMVGLELRFGF